jgi:hypothetical protein
MMMPAALSPSLAQRLRRTLLRCGPFESDAALRVVFVDARIADWRDDIPDNTPSRGRQVDAFIEALRDQRSAQGENALVLFLRVLADHTSPGDSCHQDLAQRATELAAFTHRASGEGASDTAPPAPQGSKYNITIHGGQVGAIGDNAHIESGMHFDRTEPGGKPQG